MTEDTGVVQKKRREKGLLAKTIPCVKCLGRGYSNILRLVKYLLVSCCIVLVEGFGFSARERAISRLSNLPHLQCRQKRRTGTKPQRVDVRTYFFSIFLKARLLLTLR